MAGYANSLGYLPGDDAATTRSGTAPADLGQPYVASRSGLPHINLRGLAAVVVVLLVLEHLRHRK